MRCVPFVDTVDIFSTIRAKALREHLSPYFQRKYHHEIRCGWFAATSEEPSFTLTEPLLKLAMEYHQTLLSLLDGRARTYSLLVSKRGATIRLLTASKTLHRSGLRRRGALSGTLLKIILLKRIGMRLPSA